MRLLTACLCSMLIFLQGCATIIKGPREQIALRSEPPKVKVEVRELNGELVEIGQTPLNPILSTHGGFFRGQSYRVTFVGNNKEKVSTTISSRLSGWYLGNIIFGGLVGLVIVDPATGSMWTLEPNRLEAVFAKNGTYLKGGPQRSVSIPGEFCKNKVLERLRESPENRIEIPENESLRENVTFPWNPESKIQREKSTDFTTYTLNATVVFETEGPEKRTWKFSCTARRDPWDHKQVSWELIDLSIHE